MKNNSSESLRRVLRHLKPYTGWIVLALLCAAGNVAAALYIPILVGKAVDAIVGPGQVDLRARSRPIGMQIAVRRRLLWRCGAVADERRQQPASPSASRARYPRQKAFAHLQTLPLSYLDSASRPATIVSRMIADADQFADGLLHGLHAACLPASSPSLGTLGIYVRASNWTHHARRRRADAAVPLFAAKFIATRTYDMFQRAVADARRADGAASARWSTGERVVQAVSATSRSAELRAFGALNEADCAADDPPRDVLLLADEPGHALCHQRRLRLRGASRARCPPSTGAHHGRRPDRLPQLCQPVCQAL